MRYFPKDCWDKKCTHFHETYDDYGHVCACDDLCVVCHNAEKDWAILACALEKNDETAKSGGTGNG